MTAWLDLLSALQGNLDLRDARLVSPTVRIARLGTATFSFEEIGKHMAREPSPEKDPCTIAIDKATLEGGSLILRDEVVDHVLQIENIDASLTRFSTAPDPVGQPMQARASFLLGGELVNIDFQGWPFAQPAVIGLQVRTAQIPLGTIAPYLRLPEGLRLAEGRLAVEASLGYGVPPGAEGGAQPSWTLSEGSVSLAGVGIEAEGRPVLAVKAFELEGVGIDLAQERATAQSARLQDASVTLVRDAQGRFDYQRWLSSWPAGAEPTRAPDASTRAPDASARTSGAETSGGKAESAVSRNDWQYRVELLDVTGLGLHFIDRTLLEEDRMPPVDIELHAEDLSGDLGSPVPFEVAVRLGDDSQAQASQASLRGTVTPLPFDLDAQVQVRNFDLTRFEPYFGQFGSVDLVSGRRWGEGKIDLAAEADAGLSRIRYNGDVSVNEMRAIGENLETDFVRWKALSISTASVDWRPDALGESSIEIGDIAFVDFFGRVVLDEQGQLNLSQVLATGAPAKDGSGAGSGRGEGDAATGGQEVPDESAAGSGGEATAAPRPVGADRDLAGCKRSRELHRQFRRTQLHRRPDRAIRHRDRYLDVRRQAGAGSDLRQRQPGRPSGDSRERRAAGGTAFARSQGYRPGYRTHQAHTLRGAMGGVHHREWHLVRRRALRDRGRQARGRDRFVLQKLELGERVPSADAPDLPLELALSLLRDRDGTVTLNLPINGSLADPQFSVAGLIGQALAALVRRIATAPFALLASLAGPGGDEDASREAAGRADAAIGAGHAGSSGNPGKADSAVDRRQADATAGARKAEVDLSLIRFPPGSADIGNGQRRTLQRLAQGLARRPGLQLDIAGYADRASDRQALQAAATASTDKAGETRERQADPRPRPRRGRARTP